MTVVPIRLSSHSRPTLVPDDTHHCRPVPSKGRRWTVVETGEWWRDGGAKSTAIHGEPTIRVMPDESVGETKIEPIQKRRGNPLMRTGQPSLNPKGRPPRGTSIAEIYRRGTDWEAVRARLEKIVTSSKSRDSDAVAAARELCDRAWGRPLSTHEISVSNTTHASQVRADVTDEMIDEELARIDRLLEGGTDGESSAIDAATPVVTDPEAA